ncbi:hypothetical protein GCM10007387_30880 [Pseudoduganella albidiflava]|uniref:Secreted protein n=1 Tax=Pseudoduganella albidiflava TaxID=321983 RepID=A0AA87XY36_9BURK|nr:hypothetical protein GCM10007387_30880 [Pseudoduganella albidiflava]
MTGNDNDCRVRHNMPCASKKRRILSLCIVSVCLTVTAASAKPPTSRYLGTGRACYGTLTITDKRIAWLTPFSQCKSMPYRIIERGEGRTTFRLMRSAPQCRYSVLLLTHDATEEPDKGWDITGYADELAYRKHKASNFQSYPDEILTCYLIRDPDPTGPLDW